MAEGEVISIGSRRFLVGQVIGSGAYAQVWAAKLLNEHGEEAEEVAIKEMCCGSGPGILPDATMERATFEVQSMIQLVVSADRRCEQVASPRLLEHQFWQLSPHSREALLCRVAMERRPGSPLVAWLGVRAEKAAVALQARSAAGGLQGDAAVDAYCQSFLASVSTAKEMLSQLAPTFDRLNSEIALHRDVNARNLLVHAPSDADPNPQVSGGPPTDASEMVFSLVDFGSSTCVRNWYGGSEGSWQALNPTGDARYWGPASWLRFLSGLSALQNEPTLMRQYSSRLDMYALAICAMEALDKLHGSTPAPAEAALRAFAESRSTEVILVQAIQRLRTSWGNYWTHSLESFEKLGEYSKCMCANDKLGADQKWQELGRGNIARAMLHRLHEVCEDLARVAEVCRLQGGAAAATWGQAADALEALRDMAHDNSTMEWSEITNRLGAPTRRDFGVSGRIPTTPSRSPLSQEHPASTPTFPLPGVGRPQQPFQGNPPSKFMQSPVHYDNGHVGFSPFGDIMDDGTSAGPFIIPGPTFEGDEAGLVGGPLVHSPGSIAVPDQWGMDVPFAGAPTIGSPRTGMEYSDFQMGDEERGAQLEAMRILRQVEMEVRNLKGWYSAAISAIKETEKFMANKGTELPVDQILADDGRLAN